MGDILIENLSEIIKEIQKMSPDEQIEALNQIRIALHEISPMKNEPVDLIIWKKADLIKANNYNPNTVASPEMKLLETSIKEDGYTQPIVTWPIETQFEVIDGFHRTRIGKESKNIQCRTQGYLPITIINQDRVDRGDRISTTIRHNRARGKHQVAEMSEIVQELSRRNWSEAKIGRELGMEPDEVLRLKQIGGLAEMFANKEFSEAWEPKNP